MDELTFLASKLFASSFKIDSRQKIIVVLSTILYIMGYIKLS